MSEFIPVAKIDEIPDPGRKVLELDDAFVVLFHVDGQFFCIHDVCTHDGGPLGEGHLCGHEIACPRHGAKFDICTGRALTMPATEDTVVHEVKVEGDNVYVKISED